MGTRMYIVGAGTLGRIVLDVARDLGVSVTGFVDDGASAPDAAGVVIAGGVAWLLARAGTESAIAAFVAVGDNKKRADLFRTLKAAGIALPSLVHPRAYIAPSAVVGEGNLVMPHVYVGTGVTLGDANLLFPGVCLNHDNTVGEGNFFAPGVSFGGRTRIADLSKFGLNSAVKPDVSLPSAFTCGPSDVVG